MTTVAKPSDKSNGKAKGKRKRLKSANSGPAEFTSDASWSEPAFLSDGTTAVGLAAFDAWLEHLRVRRSPISLAKLTKTAGLAALRWSLPSGYQQGLKEPAWSRVGQAEKKGKQAKPVDESSASQTLAELESWLAGSSQDDPAAFALACLATGHGLPLTAGNMSPDLWQGSLARLMDVALTSTTKRFPDPWASQLHICELPITLAYLFPELAPCRDLLRPAARRLADSLTELCDGQGMLQAEDLGWMPLLASCWTRCFAMLGAAGGRVNKDARLQYDWVVRNLLRMIRTDGRLPFQTVADGQVGEMSSMFREAVRLVNDDEDRALAKLILEQKDVPARRLPDEPGYHSEWSELAILQPEWSPQEPRLTVDFSRPVMRVEWSVAGRVVFSGDWQPQLMVEGENLQPTDDVWESLCWFSDFDVDFVELQMSLTKGWVLQRQFLMARQDQFLFVADALIGPGKPARIDYQLQITCSEGITCNPESETREGYIRGQKPLGLVMPLALPEWRNDPRHGKLEMSEGTIALQQAASHGTTLYAPLFIDLHRRRLKKPRTWRQLTVGENLEIVPLDRAVSYRIQAGPEQWLVYRSLTPPANRTTLGQNLASEFLFARFLDDGDIEPLVEIE